VAEANFQKGASKHRIICDASCAQCVVLKRGTWPLF